MKKFYLISTIKIRKISKESITFFSLDILDILWKIKMLTTNAYKIFFCYCAFVFVRMCSVCKLYIIIWLILLPRFSVDFGDNLSKETTKSYGSIFSVLTDDTKNSSQSFSSSIKSHKTEENYLESPSTKGKHELHKCLLMLQAENHR